MKWGWSEARAANESKSPGSIAWLRPLSAAVPWITVGLLTLMLYMVSGVYTRAQGLAVSLPDTGIGEGLKASLVALVIPSARETLVFFDDTRYVLDDEASLAAFGEQLAERARKAKEDSLLVLADGRVASGKLMTVAAEAKRRGIARLLFAERRERQGAK